MTARMDDQGFAIAVLVTIYGVIVLILLAIWISARRRKEPFTSHPFSRRRGAIEQRMLMEAASAIARQRDLESICAAIAHQGRELAGFENSALWLRREDGRSILSHTHFSENEPCFRESADFDELSHWSLFNAAPVPLDDTVRRTLGFEDRASAPDCLASGVVVPFIEGDRFAGCMLLCGPRHARERRSEQFLTLFGAVAAILINRGRLDEQERELRRRRQQAESLASMGTMAAGLAHEIRNPLTFIRSATEHLRDHLPREEYELSTGILEEIDRINERIGEMLTLGRPDTGRFVLVDPARIIADTTRLLAAGARGADIRLDLALDGVRVAGDEELLRRLFRNLMVNGIEAMDGAGELLVRGRAEDGWVRIEITDDGGGIPGDVSDRMYEPFFTTKERGTGLGLAISYAVAKAHGGLLELVETSERGTTFRVSLPSEQSGDLRG